MIYVYQGVRILGLGGSYRYRDGKYMYTEAQMRCRIRRLWFQLHKYGGFDILVTHAPARHINDFDNLSHRGFIALWTCWKNINRNTFFTATSIRLMGYTSPKRPSVGIPPSSTVTTIMNLCSDARGVPDCQSICPQLAEQLNMYNSVLKPSIYQKAELFSLSPIKQYGYFNEAAHQNGPVLDCFADRAVLFLGHGEEY